MAWAKTRTPKGQRGYGYEFQKLRKALLPSAYGKPCSRCGQPMLKGQELHLDHDDWDRTKLRGFSHRGYRHLAAGLLMVTGVIDYDRLGPAMRAAYDQASSPTSKPTTDRS